MHNCHKAKAFNVRIKGGTIFTIVSDTGGTIWQYSQDITTVRYDFQR